MPQKITKMPSQAPAGQAKGIDMSKVLVLILTYPDNNIPLELALWMMRVGMRFDQVGSMCRPGQYDIIRNNAIKSVEAMLPKFEWLMLLDNDMRPYGATDMFLADHGDYDVVACNYETGNKAAMITPDAFHMGLIRIKTSKMLEAIEYCRKHTKPLFNFPRTPDNMNITACECLWFANILREVKAKVIRVGHCNHSKQAVNHQ